MKKRRAQSLPPSELKRWDRKKILYLILIILISLYGVGKLIVDLSDSLFFSRPPRVNIVIYGQYPMFYSLGSSEIGNYAIEFYPDIKMQIPGGYGLYRLGALGKLSLLQKDPEMYKKTFSSITSTFVDFYFTSEQEMVHYGGIQKKDRATKPNIKDIFFMESNASLLDRIYIALLLNQIQPSSLHDISFLPFERLKEDTIFRNDNFLEKYIGLFYIKSYRNENLNIQIHYTDTKEYATAEMISNMLNGNGIIVGDITRIPKAPADCRIIEAGPQQSLTAKRLADFFGCGYQTGETDVYDILFVLGSLEKKWSIR